MNLPDIQDIKTMNLDLLHKEIFKTYERETFNLQHKQLGEDILAKEEISIDDIKTLFDFQVGEFTYYFPYADERKIYEHSFLDYRITPTKGFFWLIEPIIKERMFGLVDVEFSISKITVKATEERFENINKVYRETKNFYYDFKENKYVQINKKADNDETKEYRYREELYSAVLQRLEKENLLYLKRLENYVALFMNAKPNNVESFQEYFQLFFKFIKEEVPFLEFKFLMSHLDGENYFRIKQHLEELKEEVEGWANELSKAKAAGITDSFTEYTMYDYSKWYEAMNKTKENIQEIFKERDMKKIRESKTISKDGYYDHDEKRLYANLITIEIERAFKKIPGGVENRRKEEEELLESLLKNPKSEEKEESKELLTAAQKAHLETLTGAEKKTYILDLFNALVKEGRITVSEKVMYVRMYT